MAIPSALRSRRFRDQQAQNFLSVVTFPLAQYWFALPTVAVQKVIQMGPIYGDPRHTGVSLTRYQEREILVVDVQYRIFSRSPRRTILETSPDRFLLIIPRSDGEWLGLPIDQPPIIRRVPHSAFLPLPLPITTPATSPVSPIRSLKSPIVSLYSFSTRKN
ncbi:MAG: hypothetical protein N5P05_002097 [Chroococcopsis gigantea SAG 12.99]|nr:hypothetical protein [Chroococcopsis gigantea SAG 12.99]